MKPSAIQTLLLLLVLQLQSSAPVPRQHQDPFAGLPNPSLIELLRATWGKAGSTNIAPREGRYLHDLIIENDLKAGLEIGTSKGYSALWLGMAFRHTGGNLITIEDNQARAREAMENFREAGLVDRIDLRLEDALEAIPALAGPFDFVFIDALEEEYLDYLELVLPKVRPGGYIAAHNVTDQRSSMADFIRAITSRPNLETEFLPLTPSGISVSRKIK